MWCICVCEYACECVGGGGYRGGGGGGGGGGGVECTRASVLITLSGSDWSQCEHVYVCARCGEGGGEGNGGAGVGLGYVCMGGGGRWGSNVLYEAVSDAWPAIMFFNPVWKLSRFSTISAHTLPPRVCLQPVSVKSHCHQRHNYRRRFTGHLNNNVMLHCVWWPTSVTHN